MNKSDSGLVSKNCYLDNIIRSVNSNLRWVDEHPQVDKVVMLRAVAKHVNKKIAALQGEQITML
jgi:hypothetical protein